MEGELKARSRLLQAGSTLKWGLYLAPVTTKLLPLKERLTLGKGERITSITVGLLPTGEIPGSFCATMSSPCPLFNLPNVSLLFLHMEKVGEFAGKLETLQPFGSKWFPS